MFMMKSLAVAALMFISVLAGIQIANDGLNKMKGQPSQNALSNTPISNNAGIGAADIPSHDLQAKKQQLEAMNGLNLFSEMGKKLADGVANTSKSIVNSIANE
ncbi:DUF3679 domain-containing protein [Bacillota bacterium Lsc_1132]